MNFRWTMLTTVVAACILLLVCSLDASAESDLGFKGIGPRIGYVDPEGPFDGTVELGVVFEFGDIVRQLHWDGSVSFWSTGRDYQYLNDRYDWKLRDIILRSGVYYHFLDGPWVPYAGGGLGLHFYSWDYNNAPNWANNDDTAFGLYIEGGIEHEFNEHWTGQLQLQFDFADPVDQTALLFDLIYRLQ